MSKIATVAGAEWLTEALLPVMRERIATLGVEPSGADNFYKVRLESGRVFLDYETQLVEAIANSGLGPLDGIHEIGCGWGQFVFLLAWNGHRSAGFEMDPRRVRSARRFHSHLAERDPARAARAAILSRSFPPWRWLNPKADLVIATNLVSTHADDTLPSIIRGLRRYRYAVVDIDRFGRMRGPAERGDLVARMEEHGLRSHGVFHDTPGGHFYLFETKER